MSIIIFYSFIFLFLMFLCFILHKDVLHPVFLFCTFWFFVFWAYICCYYWYDINFVSAQTINIVGIGVVSFAISMFFQNKRVLYVKGISFDEKTYFPLGVKMLLSVGIIFGIVLTYRYFGLVNAGYDMSYVRSLYGQITTYGPIRNALEALIYSWFLQPMLFVVITMLPKQVFSKNKDKVALILMGIYLVLNMASGGRVAYYNMIVSSIVYVIFRSKINTDKKVKKKNRTRMILIVIVMIIFMYWISVQRGILSDTLLKHTLVYFSGSIPYLDIKLSRLPTNFNHTLFYCFFGGIFNIIFWLLSQFGIGVTQGWETVNSYVSQEVLIFDRIGPYTDMNAFVTPFYHFYIDGSYFGVICGSLFWGLICIYFYNNMKRKHRAIDVYIYTLLVIGIFTSMVRWQFFQSEYTLAFVFLMIMKRKTSNSISAVEN